MLVAARAAFRSCLLSASRTTPARSYRSPVPFYRPCIRKSALWYRRDGTPRSKFIGALNASFALVYAFTANAKSRSQTTEDVLCFLLIHGIDNRDFDFSKIKDSLDFFFIYIAQDKGDTKERVLDMLETSKCSRDRLRKHLEEYRQIFRNWTEGPVKTGFQLYYKKKEMISDMELRLLELPAVEVERPFRESLGGKDRYRKSEDGSMYEEVG